MGFSSPHGNMFYNNYSAEENILIQEKLIEEFYAEGKRLYPDKELHDHLALIWLARMISYGADLSDRELANIVAYSTTTIFACLSPNRAIKSLAFYIYYKENEKLIGANPMISVALMASKPGEQFNADIELVEKAEDDGNWVDLYAKYNPNLAKKMKSNQENYQNNDHISEVTHANDEDNNNNTSEKHTKPLSVEEIEIMLHRDQDEGVSKQDKQTKEENTYSDDLFKIDEQNTYTWASGATYRGDIYDGKPHGVGKYTHPEGYIYYGEWEYGKKNGRGGCIDASGTKYIGEWLEGKANGVGKVYYGNGRIYEGEVKNGKRHGQGVYVNSDGKNICGGWRNGEFVKSLGEEKQIDTTNKTTNIINGIEQKTGNRKSAESKNENIFAKKEEKYIIREEERELKSTLKNLQQLDIDQIRPWVRYIARMTDIFLFGATFVFILAIISPSFLFSIIEFGIFATPFILFIWLFLEALLLSSLGTTPGKFLLSTYVKDVRGNNLTYSNAFSRSFQVFMKGLGFGIFPINIITMIMAYRTLTKNQLGMTAWDREGEYRIRHKPIRPLRVVIFIIIWIGILWFNLF